MWDNISSGVVHKRLPRTPRIAPRGNAPVNKHRFSDSHPPARNGDTTTRRHDDTTHYTTDATAGLMTWTLPLLAPEMQRQPLHGIAQGPAQEHRESGAAVLLQRHDATNGAPVFTNKGNFPHITHTA